MKEKGHPPYQDILFIDTSTGYKFVCGSTLQPQDKDTFEGKEYPVYRVPISSASHPFYTGSQQFVDSEGRVDKFRKKYSGMKKAAAVKEEAQKEEKAPTKKPAPKKAEKPVVKKAAAKKATPKKKAAKPKKEDTES